MELKMLIKFLELIKGSRWRKASKCKSLINQLKKRLVIQKNRRFVIIRQSRGDIALLFQNGQHKDAMKRVAQLYKDQCTLSAYDQIENFCDYIYTECHNITSDLSGDMLEAVSSLIFAASRCGDLPELHLIRNLFRRQFGIEFERENVELLPGNSVNSQIKQSLSTKSATLDIKNRLISQIANERLKCQEAPGKEQDLVTEVDTLTHVCSNLSENCSTENRIPASKIGNKLQRTGSKVYSTNLKNFTCEIPEKFNATAVQKKNHKDCNGGIDLYSLPTWVEKVSSMIYMKKKATNERCNDYMIKKNDVKNSTSNRSLARIDSHVHPKLPDYDDLVSKFKDLKKEYIQQNSNDRVLNRWMRW